MTRHPITGELIEDESHWKDTQGNWLPTKFNEQKKQHEPIPQKPSPSLGGGTQGGGKEK